MSSHKGGLAEVLVIAAVVFAAVFAGASTTVVVALVVACLVVGTVVEFILWRRALRRHQPEPLGQM